MSRKKSLSDTIICENIKKLREKTGLSGTIFGENIGISQSYLSEIENLKAKPNKTLLLAISYIYNASMEWLLSGEGEMTRQGAESDASIYKVGETGEDPEIAELLSSAKKVLDSGTDRAETLAVNIRSSCQWVIKDREAENRVMLALDEIKDRLADLEQVAHPPKKVCQIIRDGDDDTRRGEILKKRKA